MKNRLTATTKINSLTISNIGVIVDISKQESFSISFTEIEKVYIKKTKLSFIEKAGIVSFLLILLFNSILFMPIELVLISLILYIPIVVYIENHRFYTLHLLQNSNGLYFKNFNRINKHEHIILVQTIRKELFDRRVNLPIPSIEVVKSAARIRVTDYPMPELSIA